MLFYKAIDLFYSFNFVTIRNFFCCFFLTIHKNSLHFGKNKILLGCLHTFKNVNRRLILMYTHDTWIVSSIILVNSNIIVPSMTLCHLVNENLGPITHKGMLT